MFLLTRHLFAIIFMAHYNVIAGNSLALGRPTNARTLPQQQAKLTYILAQIFEYVGVRVFMQMFY